MGSGLIYSGQELLDVSAQTSTRNLTPPLGAAYYYYFCPFPLPSTQSAARHQTKANTAHRPPCLTPSTVGSQPTYAAKMDEHVSQFMAITDQSADVARGCLEMTEGDVMAAVNMFFENPDIANSFNNPPPPAVAAAAASSGAAGAAASSSSSSSRRPQASSSSRSIGREDDAGVIHIDDDDDDDDDADDFDDVPDDFDDDGEDRTANPAHLQRIAQESDDAAMARRLQEEMYGGGAASVGAGGGALDPDGVRAPIARTTETLVAPSGYGGYGIGNDDDDVEAAVREMARRRARPASKPSTVLRRLENIGTALTIPGGHGDSEK